MVKRGLATEELRELRLAKELHGVVSQSMRMNCEALRRNAKELQSRAAHRLRRISQEANCGRCGGKDLKSDERDCKAGRRYDGSSAAKEKSRTDSTSHAWRRMSKARRSGGNEQNRQERTAAGRKGRELRSKAWNGAGMAWLCSGYAAIRQAKQR